MKLSNNLDEKSKKIDEFKKQIFFCSENTI